SQMIFASFGWHVTVNTVGSWVCAVLFAYVVNKLFVFESKTDSAKAFWRELGLFFGARVASLGMELVFMFVTVELLDFSEAVCKLIAQVFILVANYIFSKLIIFRKKDENA
ncbi:MAG: GtrA family protein, partial [Clostridia bacterium]|nr:GtrA family protein [Clostridia bacterium]